MRLDAAQIAQERVTGLVLEGSDDRFDSEAIQSQAQYLFSHGRPIILGINDRDSADRISMLPVHQLRFNCALLPQIIARWGERCSDLGNPNDSNSHVGKAQQ